MRFGPVTLHANAKQRIALLADEPYGEGVRLRGRRAPQVGPRPLSESRRSQVGDDRLARIDRALQLAWYKSDLIGTPAESRLACTNCRSNLRDP